MERLIVHRIGTAWLVALLSLSCPVARADDAPAPSAGQAQQTFDVYEFRILGNTTLPARDVESAVYPFLGPRKTLANVEAARVALENLYHARGFGTIFVDIPPQDVVDRVVRLRVTEGRLERTTVSGARYFSEGAILAALPEATVGSVPNIPILQQELAALNAQTPDRVIVPILKAGSVPGTMDLALKVQDDLPLHGSAEINNQSSADTSALRTDVAFNYSNFLADLDNIGIQYQGSPQDINQVAVYAANYTFHPLWAGLQPSLTYIDSSSNAAVVGTLGVLGKGQIWSAHLTEPLVTTPQATESLSLGVDYKHFRDTVNVDATTALQTPIYYLNASLAYTGHWRTPSDQLLVSVAANFGPRGLANDNALEFSDKRFEARGNYFYLRLDTSFIRELPFGTQALIRLAGQYAPEPLISNEDYSIGGIDAVRGYLEAEELGDSALKGTLQLRSPQWGHWHGTSLVDVYVFYDGGEIFTSDPLPGQPARAALRSWGAGLDLLAGTAVSGSLVIARPLTNGIETEAGYWRLLFSLRGSF